MAKTPGRLNIDDVVLSHKLISNFNPIDKFKRIDFDINWE